MQKYRVVSGFLKYNGALQKQGSIFEAEPSRVASHVKSGRLVMENPPFPLDVSVAGDSVSDQTVPELITVDQFTELKSAGQNEVLSKLGIEAGSNAKTRIKQYSDFLASSDPSLESDEDDEENEDPEGGPNTSII